MAFYSLPAPVGGSPMLECGGWQLLEGLTTPENCRALRAEAMALHGDAERSESTAADPEELRGGNPPRAFTSVVAGREQEALYQAPSLAVQLGHALGVPVRPSAERGTYSYYERAADHLGVHRDVVDCDATVVTCLRDEGDPGWECGAVCMWPRHIQASLSEVRLAPDLDAVRVRLAVGESLLLLGGFLPHAVLPVSPGQDLLFSVLCFRFEDG